MWKFLRFRLHPLFLHVCIRVWKPWGLRWLPKSQCRFVYFSIYLHPDCSNDPCHPLVISSMSDIPADYSTASYNWFMIPLKNMMIPSSNRFSNGTRPRSLLGMITGRLDLARAQMETVKETATAKQRAGGDRQRTLRSQGGKATWVIGRYVKKWWKTGSKVSKTMMSEKNLNMSKILAVTWDWVDWG